MALNGPAGARDGFDRSRARAGGGLEGGAADGDDFLRVARLDRHDRVAGVDRTLEGRGVDHLRDLRDLHDVELGGDARRDVLAGGGGRGEEGVIAGHQRNDERFDGFGEGVRERFAFGVEHLADAGDLRGGVGGGPGVVAGDEHVDVAAEGLRGGDRLRGDVVERVVGVFSENQNGHDQIAPTDLSLAMSASTSATFSPASRFLGSATFTTDRRGVTSTP